MRNNHRLFHCARLRFLLWWCPITVLLALMTFAILAWPGTLDAHPEEEGIDFDLSLSGDVFWRGRSEEGTVAPVDADDPLEFRSRNRADLEVFSSWVDLDFVVEGETSRASPVISFMEVGSEGKGAPKGYAFKTGGVAAHHVLGHWLDPLTNRRLRLHGSYGFLPHWFGVAHGDLLEFDDNVRFYTAGGIVELNLDPLPLKTVLVGISANSADLDPDITNRQSFDLDDLLRIEWRGVSPSWESPVGTIELTYFGGFEDWGEPDRIARDVTAGRYGLPFAATSKQSAFEILRNNVELSYTPLKGHTFGGLFETALNTEAVDDRQDYAYSVLGKYRFMHPWLKRKVKIDMFMLQGGYYEIDKFAMINLNNNRVPIGHHGSVIRAMAVKRLQWGPLARAVLGVEWNDPRNSDFKMSFGQSIRYFLRFDYDLGLLDILTGRQKTDPRHPRLRKRYEEHPVGR